MLSAEDIIKKVEKTMMFELNTGGKAHREVQQHLGKIINHEESVMYGQVYDEMLNRIERIMNLKSRNHWDNQNKLSYNEKVKKSVVENNLKKGW